MASNIRMLYISSDLNDLLKEEKNASALIVSLLKEHYKFKEQNQLTAQQRLDLFREQKKEILNPLLIQEEQLIKEVELKKEKLLTQEEQLIKKVEQEKEEQNQYEYLKQKEIDKQQDKKNRIFNTFKEEVGREMSEEEYQELLMRYKEELKFNLFRFIKEKKEVLNGERNI